MQERLQVIPAEYLPIGIQGYFKIHVVNIRAQEAVYYYDQIGNQKEAGKPDQSRHT
jgi:hypothetical protein